MARLCNPPSECSAPSSPCRQGSPMRPLTCTLMAATPARGGGHAGRATARVTSTMPQHASPAPCHSTRHQHHRRREAKLFRGAMGEGRAQLRRSCIAGATGPGVANVSACAAKHAEEPPHLSGPPPRRTGRSAPRAATRCPAPARRPRTAPRPVLTGRRSQTQMACRQRQVTKDAAASNIDCGQRPIAH